MIEIKTVHPEELPESFDVSAIQALIIRAVNAALDFFQEQGLQIDRDLCVKHIVGKCAIDAVLVARANIEMTLEEAIADHLAMRKRHMAECYGIVVSDDALNELGDVMRAEFERQREKFIERYPDEYDEDVDIFVYSEHLPPFHEIAALLAHEIWHLIEKKNGLFKQHELIHEGTATYIQKRFSGRDPTDICYSNKDNPFWVLYDLGAKVVHEELGDDGFQKMLDPEFRQRLIGRFNLEVLPLYFEAATNHISDIEKSSFLQNPHFADFLSAPTHENLIAANRSTGVNKMADEMSGQDTSKYIEYLKMLIS